MSDLIDRQAAITAICEDGTWLESQGCTEITMCERKQRDADILSELPTIDAEPVRHGRWIIKSNPENGWYQITCSECGEDETTVAPCIGFMPNVKVIWDYCPNCGAKMDGGDKNAIS